MNEQEFWVFLEGMWKKGRAAQLSGVMDCVDPGLQQAGKYLRGHALLPKDYDKLTQEDIVKMGSLLFVKEASPKTIEAILMLLAHQSSELALAILSKYALHPAPGFATYAEMALDECAMWNE